MRPIVSLLSDFGLKDSYVAEMKAVILSICGNAQIVDISHLITKFDVRMGAFVLASATSRFPKGTVHVAVVDPGVGTRRRSIVVETRHGLFVGPDNGLLMLAARRVGIRHVYAISNAEFMLRGVSKTFHGRDVFAPVAAHLAGGRAPSEAGAEIDDYIVPEFVEPVIGTREIKGEVLHIDDFDSIITNISAKQLGEIRVKEGDYLNIKLDRTNARLKYCSAYGKVEVNELLALVGGHGFLEVAINQGSAAKKLNAKRGMTIQLRSV
ncbi:MAG TPA: S-adenosyl-l-methionine hydroxide adenosyltransferase family protein [Candidatus Bathyarchaeia archaeon]|nr:S-adenosyl-l-methionine hydroxide adenosyltransferase family protein [Candidatus Bathyarchaeia archaeon]